MAFAREHVTGSDFTSAMHRAAAAESTAILPLARLAARSPWQASFALVTRANSSAQLN
jgi:hypothetical protein